MSNIEKIRQEIDRFKNDYLNRSYTFVPAVMQQLLEFIDSLSDENLSNNLDEAAHDYAWEKQDMVYDAEGEILMDYGPRYDAFKAGAEWMEKQGFISEGIIYQTLGEDTKIELNEHICYLEDCDDVIVNIRKKKEKK